MMGFTNGAGGLLAVAASVKASLLARLLRDSGAGLGGPSSSGIGGDESRGLAFGCGYA